jgi:hypothetical protein
MGLYITMPNPRMVRERRLFPHLRQHPLGELEAAVELVQLAQPAAHAVHLGPQLIHFALERAQLARRFRIGAAAAEPAGNGAADGRERKTDRPGHDEECDGDEDFGTANGERSGCGGPLPDDPAKIKVSAKRPI